MKKGLIIVGSILAVGAIVGFVGYKKGWFGSRPTSGDSGSSDTTSPDGTTTPAPLPPSYTPTGNKKTTPAGVIYEYKFDAPLGDDPIKRKTGIFWSNKSTGATTADSVNSTTGSQARPGTGRG